MNGLNWVSKLAWKYEIKKVKVETYRCEKCKESDRYYDCYTGICDHKKPKQNKGGESND